MNKYLSDHQRHCQAIVMDNTLSAKQKANFLATAAENNLPYPPLGEETQLALEQRIICDMYEGHAPYKPRYVLPDYALFLQQGSDYLELSPAEDFDDALNMLTILYHHVPSVTGLPVFLGYLDQLLLPYVDSLTEQQLYRRLKNFWIMLDRTLPDAFMHANIGPDDNILCRLILQIDAELKQVAPNLTLMYHPERTSQELLLQAINNICVCGKPHIANMPIHADFFDERGFGIVSCYNALPLAGGGSTLVRLNLQKIAERSTDITDFLQQQLPYYCQQQMLLIEARIHVLYQQTQFFHSSFLVSEGLIEPDRFAPMFGSYAMAEAVNLLFTQEGKTGRYGQDPAANQLAEQISRQLADFVASTPVSHGWQHRALLHAQSGISSDKGTTPGVRIPYGEEPDPVNHLLTVAPHHQYYPSGISDILTIDETIKQNPEALLQLCKGAFQLGMREFTANVAGNDLVRITGYMVRLSDIERYRQEGSRLNTTWLGSDAADNCNILQRQPRVISREQSMRYRQ